MATYRDVKKALKIKNSYELTGLTFNLTEHGEMLEKLFPGCSVYWDIWPTWTDYYMRIRLTSAWGRPAKLEDECHLEAYECLPGTLINKRIPRTPSPLYNGDPCKAKYTGPIDQWKEIHNIRRHEDR